MKKMLFFATALSLSSALFTQSDLRACSCLPPPPPAEEFEAVDAVLLAHVKSFKQVGDYRRKAELALIKVWKGPVGNLHEIFTGLSGDCGFNFQIGETYVIYAFENDGQFSTGICSRTAHVDNAGEDLGFLNERDPIFVAEETGCCGGPLSTGDAIMAGIFLLFLGRRKNAN